MLKLTKQITRRILMHLASQRWLLWVLQLSKFRWLSWFSNGRDNGARLSSSGWLWWSGLASHRSADAWGSALITPALLKIRKMLRWPRQGETGSRLIDRDNDSLNWAPVLCVGYHSFFHPSGSWFEILKTQWTCTCRQLCPCSHISSFSAPQTAEIHGYFQNLRQGLKTYLRKPRQLVSPELVTVIDGGACQRCQQNGR